MAIYTFSTKDKERPEDQELVEAIKQHCKRTNLNFSAVVLDLLRSYKEQVDGRREEV